MWDGVHLVAEENRLVRVKVLEVEGLELEGRCGVLVAQALAQPRG